MIPALSPYHLKRYKDIALLLLKYGRSDLIQTMGLNETVARENLAVAEDGKPEELAADLERMGPAYVKLGQILSSRADLLPEPYLKALSRLQDNVKPFSYGEVEEMVQRELGVRMSKAFSRFDPELLAAASLGQTHRAALRDGREVVVKVQRPGIREQIAKDLEVLDDLSTFLDQHTDTGHRYQVRKIFEEFQRTIIAELDYQREAANMIALAGNLAEFQRILVPLPVQDYTTRSVLTMDYIRGKKVTSLGPLARLELDGRPLAEEVFQAYLKQVLVDGLFHADPHPGNVFLTTDQSIALLDVGMVGRVTPSMQEHLLKLLLALSEGNGETAAELAIRISEQEKRFRPADFRRGMGILVAEHQDSTLKQIDVGRTLLALTKLAGESGLYVPMELSLLGKTLLQLEEVGRILDPEFNPSDSVRRNVSQMMNRRIEKNVTPAKIFASLLEMKDFVEALPRRLNKLLDSIVNAEAQVKIKIVDTSLLLEGIQKIANRITMGVILAALIVGAALLMRVETSFRIFGYPGLAMLCFLIAAGGGLGLVANILANDRKRKR